MIVDYAVMASDDNELYLDFWLPVSKLWKERIGITPVLLYFGDGSPSEEYGIVIKMDKNVSNLPLATCWARYWWVGQQGDKVSIITDIDMLPFSKWYLSEQVARFDNDKYIHINPCIDTYSRLPSCYHIAAGYTYDKALQLHNNFKDSLDYVLSQKYDNSTCYIKGTGNDKWCYDEYHATELLLKFDNLVMVNRIGGQSGHRIDRTDWNYDIDKVKSGYYYDSHSIRPYKKFKSEIDTLISLL
jgi:hypothetical protein